MSHTRDEIFTILSNRRRRYALHACLQFDSPMDIGDLAEQVAAWEYQKAQKALSSEERRRVYTSLQQTHLPTMADAGVIEYERGTIEPTERARELEVYIETVPESSIPWAKYYLGLSVIATALVVGVWQGIYPGSVPDLFWGGLVVILFGVSALVHLVYSNRRRIGSTGAPPGVD